MQPKVQAHKKVADQCGVGNIFSKEGGGSGGGVHSGRKCTHITRMHSQTLALKRNINNQKQPLNWDERYLICPMGVK